MATIAAVDSDTDARISKYLLDNRLASLQIRKLISEISAGNTQNALKLVRKGVDNLANMTDIISGRTPLIAAVDYGDCAQIVQLVDKAKCKINAECLVTGETALLRAVKGNSLQIVKTLAQYKPNFKAHDHRKRNALHYCLEGAANVEILKFLMEHGCDAVLNEAESEKGLTFAMLLAQHADHEKAHQVLTDLLLPSYASQSPSSTSPIVDFDALDLQSRSFLHHTIANHNWPMLATALLQVPFHQATLHALLDDVQLEPHALFALSGCALLDFAALQQEKKLFERCVQKTAGATMKFLAQRGCDIASEVDQESVPLSQLAKKVGNKAFMKDYKKTEVFYAKLFGEEAPGTISKDKVTDKYCKTILYDRLLILSWTPICNMIEKIKSEDIVQILVKSSDSEYVKVQLTKIIQNTVNPPVLDAELETTTESKPKIEKKMDLGTLLTKMGKQIGKLCTIQAYEPKKSKGKGAGGTKGKAKKTKAPKLKPSKLKESYRIEICQADQQINHERGYSSQDQDEEFQYRRCSLSAFSLPSKQDTAEMLCDDRKWYDTDQSLRIKTQGEIFTILRQGDNEEMAAYLFSQKRSQTANVSCNNFGKHALHEAAKNGDAQLCRQLLMKNCNANETDNFLWTPAHHACLGGHYECFELLAKYGANFSLQTLSDSTCLHLAVMSGNLNMVKELTVEHGLDPNQENISGQTAISLAKDFKQLWSLKRPGSASSDNEILDFLNGYMEEKKDKKKPKKSGSATSTKSAPSKVSNSKSNHSRAGLTNDLENKTKKSIERLSKSKYVKNYSLKENVPSFEITPEDLFESVNQNFRIEIL